MWRLLTPIAVALVLGVLVSARTSVTLDAVPQIDLALPADAHHQACLDPTPTPVPEATATAATDAVAAATETPAPTAEAARASATTRLVVIAANGGELRVAPALRIENLDPDVYPDVAQLLGADLKLVSTPTPGQPDASGSSVQLAMLDVRNDYRQHLESLLQDRSTNDDFGLFKRYVHPTAAEIVGLPRDQQLDRISNPVAHILSDALIPPVTTVSDGRVSIDIPQPEERLPGVSSNVGGWRISPDGRDIRFWIEGDPDAESIWNVELCLVGLRPLWSDPIPDTQEGNLLRWTFDGAEWADTQPSVLVYAEPPRLTSLLLTLASGRGRTVTTVWTYLGPALLLLIGLLLSRRPCLVDDGVMRQWRALQALTIAAAALAVAGALAVVARQQASGPLTLATPELIVNLTAVGAAGTILLAPGKSSAQWLWRAAPYLPALAFLVVAAGQTIVAASVRPWERWLFISNGIAVAGYFAFLSIAGSTWLQMKWRQPPAPASGDRAESQADHTRTDIALVQGGLIVMGFLGLFVGSYRSLGGGKGAETALTRTIAAITPIWVTICVVIGILLFASAFWTAQASPALRGRLRRPHWVVAALALAGVILTQWALATYNQQNLWWRSLVEDRPGDRFPVFYTARLQEFLANFPAAFVGPTLEVLPLLGLAGLVGLLRVVGTQSQSPFWGVDGPWLRRILAFLFSAFVIGYGGQVLGLRAPLAFLLGMLLLWPAVVWTTDLERISRELDHLDLDPSPNDPARLPGVVVMRRELTRLALALDFLDQKRAAAIADTATKESDVARYREAIETIEKEEAAQRTKPLRSSDRTRRIVLQASHNPRELALALGPGSTWWENAVVATRLGSLLALLPVAYFANQLLSRDPVGGSVVGALLATTGPVSTSLVYEVAFWLVAAFVFGCLFPYLRGAAGPAKGAVLAAVYLGANAGAALLGTPGDPLWQVRSFQLVLFLMVLGFLLDRKTVQDLRLPSSFLKQSYELGQVKTIVNNILPLVIALTAVVAQLYLGNTGAATQSLIEAETVEALKAALAPLG